jgi:hypothetical protein
MKDLHSSNTLTLVRTEDDNLATYLGARRPGDPVTFFVSGKISEVNGDDVVININQIKINKSELDAMPERQGAPDVVVEDFDKDVPVVLLGGDE